MKVWVMESGEDEQCASFAVAATLDDAADVLGVRREQINYYAIDEYEFAEVDDVLLRRLEFYGSVAERSNATDC